MDSDSMITIILLAVAAADVALLRCLSSRRSSINRAKHVRFFLWAAFVMYFPLISYILTYLTSDLSSLSGPTWSQKGMDEDDMVRLFRLLVVVMLIILVLSLKSNADMAALAVAALASPAAGDDDIHSQKIRPSMDGLVKSFSVAGVFIYTIMRVYAHKEQDDGPFSLIFRDVFFRSLFVVSLIWALGTGRMVLTFAAFQHANGSFALGRNAQLIDGYMAQLQEGGSMDQGAVPPLILTGERNEHVEESPHGYRVKRRSTLEYGWSSLVTLDKVWSSHDHRLSPELKDLCLSFCLFKCLRRRFAGYRLTEAGSTWAFLFVCDGLLRREDESDEDDHERMFRVISHELSFASDFYYSPIPVASLGPWSAAFHFILSLLICATLSSISIFLFIIVLRLLFAIAAGRVKLDDQAVLLIVLTFLSAVGSFIEIWAIVSSVRSNWTKISMVACCISRPRWSRMISSCLLKCKSPRHWKDEIGQSLLLKPIPPQDHYHLLTQIFRPRRNHDKIKSYVKAAVIRSFRIGGRQLSNGIATVQRRCPHLSWACHGGITTSTDAILVWYIATSLFEIKYPSSADDPASTNMAVANNLSRYCAYLVADAPDLLPDNAAWIKSWYQQVKERVETSMRGADSGPGLYSHLIQSFGKEDSHEVLKMGSRLGEQLVGEVGRQTEEIRAENQQETAGGEKEAVWELLAEFWSEMILYLAPSDNVKGHIEALQRGGELITLLWALLLHAGITTRPVHDVPRP